MEREDIRVGAQCLSTAHWVQVFADGACVGDSHWGASGDECWGDRREGLVPNKQSLGGDRVCVSGRRWDVGAAGCVMR